MKPEFMTLSSQLVPPSTEEFREAARLGKELTGELLHEIRSNAKRSAPPASGQVQALQTENERLAQENSALKLRELLNS